MASTGGQSALSVQDGFEQLLGLGPELSFWAAAFFHGFLLFNFYGVLPAFFIWLERKVSARIQDRLGPTRVGGRFGWLQSVADGIKLVQKEDLSPLAADRWLFGLAPFIAVIASFSAFVVLPFSNGWTAVVAETGVFLILALMSLEVVAIVLAGYSSGSKWALFGAMREAAQMVSYEIPMAICMLIPIVIAGTMNLVELGRFQEGLVWNWFIFQNPFSFLAFWIYFTVSLASVKRAPFDLAEAESELVAGFHTEYSGLRWSFFFLAEYASMFAVAGIAVVLFLGGWWTGTGIETALGGLTTVGQDFPVAGFQIGSYLLNLLGLGVFIVKCTILVFVQMWVRWTLPRLRIDQVMTTCLKYLTPISCALFLGTLLWGQLLAQFRGRPQLIGRPAGWLNARVETKPTAGGVLVTACRDAVPGAVVPGEVVPERSETDGSSQP